MEEYRPTSDPALYCLCVLFAGMATFLPGFTGHNWLLTGGQGLGLWIFTAVAARYGPPGRHLALAALWMLAQILSLALAYRINPAAVEETIPMGFARHRHWLAMHYTAEGPGLGPVVPGGAWLLQVLAGSIGSLVSGGLTGSLVLSNAGNHMGLGMAVLVFDVMDRDPAAAGHFLWTVIPWGHAVLMIGTGGMHLALMPWLWQRRSLKPAPWSWQRPLLYLGAGLAIAGLSLLAVGGIPWATMVP